ncbi:MAG: hypothetical protein WBG19_09640 [Thermoplasmata archaeon]
MRWSPWSLELTARVAALWPHKSAEQIRRELGVEHISRCGVIAKMNRMGLKKCPHKAKKNDRDIRYREFIQRRTA